MKRLLIAILILIACFSIKGISAAVEVDPRISDREIIESLAEIKATLKSMEEQFRQVDKRFELVDKRFEEIQENIRFLFGIVITMIIALFGYMVWDRRTMMKPLESKIISIEGELEIGRKDGTKLNRLINALRELSKEDPKVEKILKDFHLL